MRRAIEIILAGGLAVLLIGNGLAMLFAAPWWQASQSTVAWAPVSGKRLLCC